MEEKLKKYLTIESHEILNEFSVGIIICNNLYEVLFINKTFIELAQFYGLSIQSESLPKNLFEIEFFNDDTIKREISFLLKGLPFESEISSSNFSKKGPIKLIVKATPLLENGLFSGAIFIIEDLRVALESTAEYIKRNADLQKVIEQTSDFFLIVNKDYAINQYSINLPLLLKSSIDQSDEPNINDIVHSDDLRVISYYLNYSKLEKKVARFNIRLKNEFDYQCKIVPITNKLSEVVYYYLFFDKIDSRTIASKSADKNFIYYEELISNIDLQYVIYNQDFSLVQISKDLLTEFFSEENVSTNSKKVYESLPFISKEILEQAEIELNKSSRFLKQISYTEKNKNQKFFELKFSFTKDEKRILFIKDITDDYVLNRKLKNKVSAFEGILNHSLQMVLLLKSNGEIVFANNTFCENLGFDRKTLLTKSFYNLIDPSYLEKNIFDLSAFTNKKSKDLDLPLIKSTGEKINLLTYFTPLKTSEGNLIFIAGYFSELDKVKAKETELNFYTEVINNAFDGIAIIENSKFIRVNKSFYQLFDYEDELELEGRNFLDVVFDDDTIRVSEFIRLVELKKLSPGKIDFVGRKRDNSRIYIEMSVGRLEIDSRVVLILSARDTTEKILTHREIRESEEKYRTITENLDDCLFTFERFGFMLKPIFCTSSIKKITGYNQLDFLSDSKFFFRIAFPEDFRKIKPKLLDILKSKSKKSGELEFRIINKDGNVLWVKTKLNIQRSLSGSIQKIYGMLSDITVSKKNEEEIKKANEELMKLNETKDRFISIVSHDLRTPFTSILGFTDLLENDDSLSEQERKQYVRFIRESAQTMLSLVNSVLDWTRLQTGRINFEPEKTNISEVIRKAVNSLSGAAIQKSINIYNLVTDDIYLFVDKNLISQVFYNLISNAIKFTRPNGKIEISASPNSTHTFYNFSIKDTGIGIKPENLDKLFSVDSKFTTEGTSGEKGSGLGLSLVKEIIEKHNGRIWVESQYGKGSNFQFSLPASSAIILLVQPDNADRMLLSKLIKNFKPDFSIQTETFGNEALNKIKILNPALIILDNNLSDMNGLEFLKKMIKLNLHRKIQIIVTASTIDRAIVNDYNELGVEFVISKPINLNTLQQAIEKSLIKSFQRTRI